MATALELLIDMKNESRLLQQTTKKCQHTNTDHYRYCLEVCIKQNITQTHLGRIKETCEVPFAGKLSHLH